jgi:hypothetical protein
MKFTTVCWWVVFVQVEWDEIVDKLTCMESECKASWDCLREIAKHDSSSQFKQK